MKVFVIDLARCNGCFNCQIACKDEHCDNDWPPIAAAQPDTGHFWMKVDTITHGQIPKVRVEYRPLFCNHCSEAPCIKAGGGCVYRREDGLVIIDPVEAKGRYNIVESCPYGYIYWNETAQLAQKCTGCAHLVDAGELPHCVDLCATGALRFGEEEDFVKEIESAELLVDEALGPRAYYLNLPHLFIAGEVWDPQPNEIIEAAHVTLHCPGGMVRETDTDGFGDFWFTSLTAGEYKITINAEKYMPTEASVSLTSSKNLGDFPLVRELKKADYDKSREK
jgi:Fe-S-cluster-containing dehydrogenase component